MGLRIFHVCFLNRFSSTSICTVTSPIGEKIVVSKFSPIFSINQNLVPKFIGSKSIPICVSWTGLVQPPPLGFPLGDETAVVNFSYNFGA